MNRVNVVLYKRLKLLRAFWITYNQFINRVNVNRVNVVLYNRNWSRHLKKHETIYNIWNWTLMGDSQGNFCLFFLLSLWQLELPAIFPVFLFFSGKIMGYTQVILWWMIFSLAQCTKFFVGVCECAKPKRSTACELNSFFGNPGLIYLLYVITLSLMTCNNLYSPKQKMTGW